jgi:hypothetical protein
MPTGKKTLTTASKSNHMNNFEEAMKEALKGWSGSRDEDVPVRFEVTVTPNPGGVKEYRVIIGS